MSAVEVSYDDIKVGDRIRITREITVASVYEDGQFLHDDAPDRGMFFAGGAKLERLPKPFVLPTKVGSVVKLSFSGGFYSNWMLNDRDYWNSDRGGVKRPIELERFIERNMLQVEVIA